jgi:NTP pyrophosphatase (non-canonical NTP hydrolase)
MNDINQLTESLIRFRDARDWAQFHNPKDLALALSIEASELNECFLWKKPHEANKDKVAEELADVFAYALLLAHEMQLDVAAIVSEKIRKNELKYPVDKAKGTAAKYDEL